MSVNHYIIVVILLSRSSHCILVVFRRISSTEIFVPWNDPILAAKIMLILSCSQYQDQRGVGAGGGDTKRNVFGHVS